MIPFVREMTPRYGEPEIVSPLIRRILARNPGPFTYLGTGTYVVGQGEVAVIDPGPADDTHLAAITAALGSERVGAIVITHSHLDHSPLARPLQALTGAPIYGRPDPGAGPSLEEDSQENFRPDREVAEGERIAGPGWTLRAILTPGHVSNHVAYALEEENALFTGDHVMGWSTTVVSPPDGDMDAYFASLDKVERGGFDVLWPTHGPPVREVGPFLAAYRSHRVERERQVLAALAEGPRTIPEIVAELYAAVDPRLHGAAGRSVLAHLIRLVRAGSATADPAPVSDARFARR